MPIVDFENSKQLEFGYGDIKVAPGLLKTEDKIGVVCFFQSEALSKIGTHIQYPEEIEVNLEDTPVRMVFNKIESIDVVIKSLEEIKQLMKG